MQTMEFQSLLALVVFHLRQCPVFHFIVFVLLFSVCAWSHKRNSQYAVPYWPFLGHLPSLLWNYDRLYDWITQAFVSLGKGSFYFEGPIFSNLNYIVTCDPQNIEYILRTNFKNYPKGPGFKQVFDIFGDGIFNLDSDVWRVQRRIAHASFNSEGFRTLVAESSRKIVEEQLIPVLANAAKQGSAIDLQDVCSRFAYDSSISTAVGKNERYLSADLPDNELAKAFDDVHDAIVYRHAMPIFAWKLLRWLGIGAERKLSKAWKRIDINLDRIISDKREDLLGGVQTTADLSSSYIRSSEDNKFLRDVILTFTSAGRDAITSALTWFFWLVFVTPSVEMKILDELKMVISSKMLDDDDSNNKWPWVFHSEELKGLVYLHAALCESLRLFPSVPLNSKASVKEDVLPDGTKVRPGMQIILAFYTVGRMPWIWGEDCLEFKPERWIDETGKLRYGLLSKLFAFNIGPRACLGQQIAFTQMKSAVASLLFNFHIEVVEGQNACAKPAINLLMKNGLRVNIKKRL